MIELIILFFYASIGAGVYGWADGKTSSKITAVLASTLWPFLLGMLLAQKCEEKLGDKPSTED